MMVSLRSSIDLVEDVKRIVVGYVRDLPALFLVRGTS